MPKLTVEGFDPVEVAEGKRLVLAIEQDAKVDVLHACGGNARCTTCRVEFVDGRALDDDRRRTNGARRQGCHRRASVVSDPLRSRHDRTSHLAAHRIRPPRSRADADAGHHAAPGVGDEVAALRIPLPDLRDEVVVEGRVEVVARREPPVAARGALVDVGRPRVDDALPLRVGVPRDPRGRKRPRNDRPDLVGGGVEGADVVRRPRQALLAGPTRAAAASRRRRASP